MKKNKYGMPPPATRKEFEHNVNLVIEDVNRIIDSGNETRIANRLWATIPHLKKVSYLPNRRINIGSVNEMLRTQANLMDWMERFPPPEPIESVDKGDK